MELPIPTAGDDPELRDLAARARGGSADAFDALARRVRASVRGWATRFTRDTDDAEDIAQLVLLRLHERLDQFEGRGRVSTWLYSITRRIALSSRRTRRRRDAILASRPEEFEGETTIDEARTEEHSSHVAELARAFLEELPRREREAFVMADLQGMSPNAVAEALGVKAVTVRVMLLKARRKMRLRMLEEHPDLLEEYR